MNRWKNRTFISLLFMYMAAILIVEVSIFGFTLKREIERSNARTEEANAQAMENVRSYLDGLIQDEITLGERVRNSSWAIKLNSDTTVFDDQFTYLRKSEIMEDFLFDVSTGDVIGSRTVYFKGRGLAVSKTQWCSVEYYLRSIGLPRDLCRPVLEEIEQLKTATQLEWTDENGNSYFGKNTVFAIPLKVGSANACRIFLCTTFNSDNIVKSIKKMLPQSIVGMRILSEKTGSEIMRCGSGWDEAEYTQASVSVIRAGWTAEFLIDDAVIYIDPGFIRENALGYFLMLLLAVVASVLLSAITYHPVQQLLKKLTPVSTSPNAYRAIGDSIDSMVKKLKESRRAEAIRQLLAGYFGTAREVEHDVPFREDMAVRVLIFSDGDNHFIRYDVIDGLRRTVEKTENVCHEIVEALDKSIILAIGSKDAGALHAVSRQVMDYVAQQHWNGHVFAGDLSTGLIGISISYQSAQDKRQYLSGYGASRYYFPFDWESQLLQAIRQGKMAVADGIFRELQTENYRRLAAYEMAGSDMMPLFHRLSSDVGRCALEMAAEERVSPLLQQIGRGETYDEMWELLHEAIVEVCSISQQHQEPAADVDRSIVSYIDLHFDDVNMGITVLQDRFGLSANTINKSIRNLTGLTFSSYLIKCRMDKAKLLLQDPSLKIPAIAQMVGYENDYSFRRAFLRYVGCKVQEYRQMPDLNAEETDEADG